MSDAAARQALASIGGFADARLGPRLADGPASSSWRVWQGGGDWVLRLDKPAAAALGLDRANERAVAAAVARAGLTPAYRHFDVQAGVALRPFAEGRPWTREDLGDAARLAELAVALRELHRLPPVGRAYDPVAAAYRYARQVGTDQAAQLAGRAQAAWDDIPSSGSDPVLCHNDLVADNILQTAQGVRLIDWEYTGLGDGLFDLAVVLEHHGLGENLTQPFLAVYLQRDPTPTERERLAALRRFYALLLNLWLLRTTNQT